MKVFMAGFVVTTSAILAINLGACAWDRVNPDIYKPLPDNKCGAVGVECGHHLCCSEGETCGGPGRSCPDGMCCDVRQIPAFSVKHPMTPDDGGTNR